MAIRPQPEIVDLHGFRRRAWEFDYQGGRYYIHQTDGGFAILVWTVNEVWAAVDEAKVEEILVGFKAEHKPATGDFLTD